MDYIVLLRDITNTIYNGVYAMAKFENEREFREWYGKSDDAGPRRQHYAVMRQGISEAEARAIVYSEENLTVLRTANIAQAHGLEEVVIAINTAQSSLSIIHERMGARATKLSPALRRLSQ
jgi:hypothetical protein